MKIKSSGAGTIVLREGVYHESVKAETNRSATIQNYPGEAVWFDGSVPVTNWTASGSTWQSTGWTTEFSSLMGGGATYKNQFLAANKVAPDPDQVFINGAALKQVATAAEVVAGTFAVNDADRHPHHRFRPDRQAGPGQRSPAGDLPVRQGLRGPGHRCSPLRQPV